MPYLTEIENQSKSDVYVPMDYEVVEYLPYAVSEFQELYEKVTGGLKTVIHLDIKTKGLASPGGIDTFDFTEYGFAEFRISSARKPFQDLGMDRDDSYTTIVVHAGFLHDQAQGQKGMIRHGNNFPVRTPLERWFNIHGYDLENFKN